MIQMLDDLEYPPKNPDQVSQQLTMLKKYEDLCKGTESFFTKFMKAVAMVLCAAVGSSLVLLSDLVSV